MSDPYIYNTGSKSPPDFPRPVKANIDTGTGTKKGNRDSQAYAPLPGSEFLCKAEQHVQEREIRYGQFNEIISSF